ncbi:MAG: CbiX/SirB N-terminal domain-containing protein [Rhodobacteraceae bacterium]|nr:CbiX/SirB N-terminal domain-containing protein [Paracoccaceae bacterium]
MTPTAAAADSPPAATVLEAVIVAHGQPGDPEPQEAALQALAARVAAHLPGATLRGATLAQPGALEAALAGLAAPLVYPFFMAEGYFTGRALPARLRQTGAKARQTAPFGTDPALPALMAGAALAAAAEAGIDPAGATLLLAAHGSQVSASSKDTVYAMAAALRRLTPFRAVTVGLIEEPPFLAAAARGLGPALCLPFFALRAGHVVGDIPEALAEAGFAGPLLPPIGEHPGVPALIAAALAREAAVAPG